ncbi:MAG: hypothetical protein PHV05_12890 [Candidatus Riflebacteria bacterium]|nr:hypothetical protein [Candidatus Riflebacteria bacterium]
MKKLKSKKSIVALCIIVPIAAALAFVPKIVAEHKKRKYTSTSF